MIFHQQKYTSRAAQNIHYGEYIKPVTNGLIGNSEQIVLVRILDPGSDDISRVETARVA